MKKSIIFTSITAAIALASGSSIADDVMEKCVINKDGKSLIKAHKADCSTSKYSCGGQNIANDPEAWIFVPKGECDKIKMGDYSGVNEDIKDKIEGAS